jgi:hypothetical protein
LTVLVFAQGLHYVTNAYLVTEQFRSKTASKAHAVALIPPDAAVSATNKLGSHLSARRHVYSFPLTDRADWIAVDVEDSWMPRVAVRARSGPGLRVRAIEGFMRPQVMAAKVAALRADPRWELVYEEDRVLVFRRVLPTTELARQASART